MLDNFILTAQCDEFSSWDYDDWYDEEDSDWGKE